MSKTIRRLMLNDYWEIGKNECWLSTMAEQGLFLKKFSPLFVHFTKGLPEKRQYRIDIAETPLSEEELTMYRECGWNLAVRSRYFYYFYTTENLEQVTELHTDPAEQSYTLALLYKNQRLAFIMMTIGLVLFFGMIFAIYFLSPEPTLQMLSATFAQQMLLMVLELYIGITFARSYFALRRLQQNLLAGQPINHRQPFQKSRNRSFIALVLTTIIGILGIVLPLVGMAKAERVPLPLGAIALPTIRLAEIERDPALVRQVSRFQDGLDFNNYLQSEWSILAPLQYEIKESGLIANQQWHDTSEAYSPSLTTCYYHLTVSSLADNLVKDLINRYCWRYEGYNAVEITVPAFTHCYLACDDTEQQLFAYRGGDVLQITYYGQQDLQARLPEITAAFLNYCGD